MYKLPSQLIVDQLEGSVPVRLFENKELQQK